MRHAYIIHIDWIRQQSLAAQPPLAFEQEQDGLVPRWTEGLSTLRTSIDTPIIDLSGGGCVVGDLYFRDGSQIRAVDQLPLLPTVAAVRRYMLANCWGDYILVQPVPGNPRALSVLRSPSHACELPCLYSLSESEAFITSDLTLARNLKSYQRRVDYESIIHRLIYPDARMSRTALMGVSELLPGQSMQLRDGRSDVSQDWSPWNHVAPDMRFATIDEAVAAVRGVVGMAVKTLADRDRCVLLELSGGLDSSIVGTCLQRSNAKVSCATFTASAPGADERDYAIEIARMLGVELLQTELRFEDAQIEFSVPPALASPSVGPLQHAIDGLMQSSAAQCGAESFFSGAGGDSIFGYLTSAAPAVDAFRAAGPRAGFRAIGDISTFHQCTYWRAGRLALRRALMRSPPFKPDLSLLAPGLQAPQPDLNSCLMPPPNTLPGDRQRILEINAAQGFQESGLRSFTKPIRMPLLSQPVIETCLRVPSWMWFEGGQNRAVARLAFSDLLPSKVSARRSKGSLTAYLGAVHRRKKHEITNFLVGGALHAQGLVDADALRRLEAREQFSDDTLFMRLFQLCAIENWVRQQARHH
jgi:asparagine synthase (glutamine-hydrolysing)